MITQTCDAVSPAMRPRSARSLMLSCGIALAASVVVAAALSRASDLGLPFASWTLDCFVASLCEQGVGMRRSRTSEILLAEGLKWRGEETWFGERVDPSSPTQGGDRAALHQPAGGQHRRLPR